MQMMDGRPWRRKPRRKHWQQLLLAACGVGLLWRADAATFADDMAKSEIHTRALRGNLHVLLGFGSNITVSTGPDGTLLVDDEYAALTNKVRAALAELRSPAIKLIVNTHWHADHTGGNESFARAGALIIAQENAGRRMRSDQTQALYGLQKAYPPMAWPAITFNESLRLRWNGDEIDVIHIGPAHTDGDSVVFFRQQNVMATGDLFVGYLYRPPYFDDLNGGSAHGMIAAADTLLNLVDERTIIVPGHGDVTDRAGLQDYRDHLVAIRDSITDAIAHGSSEDQVVALHPTEGFAKAGRGTDRWVRVVYREYRRGVDTGHSEPVR
jgi:glyoxylase-like metal-dependent hydrolase (beta-lactamase superfamily II)